MKEKFSFKRVGLLLKYDWEQYRLTILAILAIYEILYIIFHLIIPAFLGFNNDSVDISEQNCQFIALSSLLVYLGFIIVLFICFLGSINADYIVPASATRYMMLPATKCERFSVIHIKLGLIIVAIFILNKINLLISNPLISTGFSYTYNWSYNFLTGSFESAITSPTPEIVADSLENTNSLTYSFNYGWQLSILLYLVFINLIFTYKKNQLLRGIVTSLGLLVIYSLYIVFIFKISNHVWIARFDPAITFTFYYILSFIPDRNRVV